MNENRSLLEDGIYAFTVGAYTVSIVVSTVANGIGTITKGAYKVTKGVCTMTEGVFTIVNGVYHVTKGVCSLGFYIFQALHFYLSKYPEKSDDTFMVIGNEDEEYVFVELEELEDMIQNL